MVKPYLARLKAQAEVWIMKALSSFTRTLLTSCLLAVGTLFSIGNGYGQTIGLMQYDSLAHEAYTLFSSSEAVYLIDNCGFLVHEWNTEGKPGLSTYLKEDGVLLRTKRLASEVFNGGGIGGEVSYWDWDSNKLWGYEIANDTIHSHHDVASLPNGNILVLCWELITEEEALQAGRDPENLNGPMWATVILEIEPVGDSEANIIWQWRIWEHLIQDFDETKDNYGVVADHPELLDLNFESSGIGPSANVDWLHCNAVNYNSQFDQIMISARYANELFFIDHSTSQSESASHEGGAHGKGGDLIYRWGNPQNYDRGGPLNRKLFEQHDCQWVPEGYPGSGGVTLFNNLVSSNASHVNLFYPPVDSLGFYEDPGTEAYGPVQFSWNYSAPGFYSHNISGAQRLINGNTLICEGDDGKFFEVTQGGVKVWEYINPINIQGPMTQGSTPISNTCFRATKYNADFPGLAGQDLTPGAPIELEPLDYECMAFSVDTTTTDTTTVDTTNTDTVITLLLTNALKGLKVYPIPFVNQLRVESVASSVQIEILDLHGRLLFVGRGNNTIATDEWPAGMYLLRAKDDAQTITKKIIKF